MSIHGEVNYFRKFSRWMDFCKHLSGSGLWRHCENFLNLSECGLVGRDTSDYITSKGFSLGKNHQSYSRARSETLVNTVDDRSPIAKSFSKASEVTSISIMMIVPGLVGYWIDQKVGSVLVFTLLGLALGMGVAVRQLMLLVSNPIDAGRVSEVDSDEESQQG